MSHAADAADAGLMTRCDRIVGGASRDRTDDLRVANATLSQLSYGPIPLEGPGTTHATRNLRVVGLGGVEPPTSPLSGVRSNQLSYRPDGGHASDCPEGLSTN